MKVVVALLALALAAPALANKTDGVVPGMVFGPKLTLVGFPTPAVGAEAKLDGWVGLSFDYGYVPPFKVKEARVGWDNWSAGAKVFPFRGAFFLGALYGQRSIRVKVKDQSSDLEGSARISSRYLAPELGWRWSWEVGFTMGMDLGWQFVTGSSKRITIPGGFDAEKEKDVRDITRRVANQGIPVLGLLEVGWML
jgi:hypothetical protein